MSAILLLLVDRLRGAYNHRLAVIICLYADREQPVVELRIFTEPQEGASYEQQLAMAKAAELLGFGAYFRSDHFVRIGEGSPLPGPTDAWVTLGALARETSTIRLGTLVTSATFRHPGLLAVAVAQVDQMSDGRVELGLGSGWFEREHAAYGVPFPTFGERFERLTEQLEIVTGLWATPPGDLFSHEGIHYRLQECPALPKPRQSPPPLIIGGTGPRRTPELAARFAAEFNMPFASVEQTKTQFERVGVACDASGRDPGEMIYSAAITICCAEDEATLRHRARRIGRELEDLRSNGAAGSPAEVAERLRAFAEVGAERAYLQVIDFDDIEHVELIAAEVMPQLA
jgi:F420-dependent oxidoreductase-like protein